MNTVEMAYECACFKKSEYEAKKAFDNQQDAYNYANVLAELMNEEFCSTHQFVSQKTEDDNFIIGVFDNPNAGSCGTGSSDSSCDSGSCGC
ncbi:hypothetical protein GJV85_10785 [Sulfurimonas aquatica]|uniref:Uncharacterized protein n=1 Tax=Sulfurimonas aquatica TaxID=2672570 RepID=A0A975B1L5_9BACT|nr:hypothetical protein [Sulfurimonas aquatica]QSZ42572.1 hypothetical protein GJV85_10785 [Sulfurimonas aquatica]